ncbi:LLM class flavin-dependent oxidoreductase [Nitrospirillum sp. BR 11828]|uniref:LLM class flavin-dependent oxidoreductase n=1 Tax=Nitrospirillum sp. BR 11828 TaxID=3104325 RepID=UPI002ACAF9DB|nr:LLM class flavin-dependent oxidoreductase [Nitrospirillum sp. BR 11828]MDZ5648257.1 LLM class flavin-dependent oxidoreductase [Nitrospirillum sp. BR 11828]
MYLSISIDVSPRDGAAFAQLAQQADRIEQAGADFVLLAHETGAGTLEPGRLEAVVTLPWIARRLATPVVVAALPAVHSVPFHIARALSAADFLTAGRVGWLPLLQGGARFDAAYGDAYHLPPGDRVAKHDDFIRATRALWDSWDQDALILNKDSGAYLDSAKVRRVDYRGPFFATMGPLNAARPPQGHPLLVRDLDDVAGDDGAGSAIPADVVLGGADRLAGVEARGTVRLLKVTAATLEQGEALVRDGKADGLHVAGPDAIERVEALRRRHTRRPVTGATARARLGLAMPANPYSKKVPA